MKFNVKLIDLDTGEGNLLCNINTGNIKWWKTEQNAKKFCNRFNNKLKKGKKLIVVRSD